MTHLHNRKKWLRGQLVGKVHLRFFDVDMSVQSNSPDFLEQVARLHPEALVTASNDAGGTPRHHLTVEFYSKPGDDFAHPTLVLDGRAYPLPKQPLIDGYLDGLITMHASQRVRSHLLIHAGAVAYDGQGVILAADSMHGKTTLTLELLHRGFCLLSDDVAAVGRKDGLLHTYPRALLVRPGALELAGLHPSSTGSDWNGKWLFHAEELGLNHCTKPMPLTHIVIMQDAPPEHDGGPGEHQDMDFALTLSALDPVLLQAIRKLEPIMKAEPVLDSPLPVLRLRATSAVQAMEQLQPLCDDHRVLILDYLSKARRPPLFDRPARLEPMSKHDALMALAHGFRAGHNSALLSGGSAGELIMELADTVANASCHRLTVGPLADSADLVCQLLGTDAHPRRIA